MPEKKQVYARRGCQIVLEDLNTHALVAYELYAPTGNLTWTDRPASKLLEDGFLSIKSPLGKELYGKVVGDTVRNYRINSIHETERAIAYEDPLSEAKRLEDDKTHDLFNRFTSGEWLYGRFEYYEPIIIQKKQDYVKCESEYNENQQFVYSISNRHDEVSSDLFDSVIYIFGSKADILTRSRTKLEANILIDGTILDKLNLPRKMCTFSVREDDFTDSEKILTMKVRIDPETKRFVVKYDAAGLIYYLNTGEKRLSYSSLVDDYDDDDWLSDIEAL